MTTANSGIIFSAMVALGAAGVLFILRSTAFALLHRWAHRTETKADDLLISAVRLPSILWCIALGLYAGLLFSELEEKHVEILTKLISVIIAVSVTAAAASFAGHLFKEYVQSSGLPIPSTGLAYGIIKGTIYVVGGLIVLSMLGVSIAPLITTLGLGGLAVALALQDTLANIFAGMHILMERSVRVGDFIELESGQKGYVTDITWRTTRVRLLPNNMVIIPNSKLSQSIVTNYYLPETRMSLLIPVGVSYDADPVVVERILIEEAKKAVGEIEGMVGDPEPFVRFIPGFGESALEFTLICQVREFVDQYLVQHELRKRIFSRLRVEGIEIPFPQRTVHIRNPKEDK